MAAYHGRSFSWLAHTRDDLDSLLNKSVQPALALVLQSYSERGMRRSTLVASSSAYIVSIESSARTRLGQLMFAPLLQLSVIGFMPGPVLVYLPDVTLLEGTLNGIRPSRASSGSVSDRGPCHGSNSRITVTANDAAAMTIRR